MAEKAFTAYEALKIATAMEEDGIAFYEALAAATDREEIVVLAQKLASDEHRHIREIQALIDAEEYDNAWGPEDLQMISYYLDQHVPRDVFPGREAAAEISKELTNLYDALTLAIRLERQTVEYYEKLRETCTYDTGRRAFAQLVDEECKHQADLEEARGALG